MLEPLGPEHRELRPRLPWKKHSLLDVSREEVEEFVAEVDVLADGMVLQSEFGD